MGADDEDCCRLAAATSNPAIHGRTSGLPSNTQGGSRVRELRMLGSVRGRSAMGIPTAIQDTIFLSSRYVSHSATKAAQSHVEALVSIV